MLFKGLVYISLIYQTVQLCHYTCRSCVGNNYNQCLQCQSQYWFHQISDHSYGTCIACTTNCASCLNQKKCQTCYPGYYLSQATGLCSQCEKGAQLCTLSAIQKCQQGYEELNGQCISCSQNCVACLNGECQQCDQKFYLTDQNQCDLCQIQHCSICPNPDDFANTCYQCQFGYTGDTCTQLCSQNCAICFSNICFSCRQNYELINNTCYILPILCKQGSAQSCSQCLQEISYMTNQGRCIAYYSLNKQITQEYYTSKNNQKNFGTQIINNTLLSQYLTLIECNSFSFIKTGNGNQIYLQFQSNPIYSFDLKFILMIDPHIENIMLTITLINKNENTIRNLNNRKNITLTQKHKALSRSCTQQNAIIVSLQSNNHNQISEIEPIFNSSSQKVIVSFTSQNGNSIGVSQILLNFKNCQINNCETCSLPFLCVSCYYPYLLENNQCVKQCSTGYYLIKIQNRCQLQCPDYYYPILQDFLCLQCISPCDLCLNSTFCQSCVTGFFLHEGFCQVQCPVGYYKDIELSICQTCVYPCFQCINGTQCLSCAVGYLDYSQKICVFQCPEQKYLNFITLNCQPCIYPCLKCITQSQCQICVQGYYLLKQQSTCILQCDNGTFIEITFSQKYNESYITCLKCDYPCLFCEDEANLCLSCIQGFLLDSQCINQCPDGFYSKQNQCIPCISPCQTCLSQFQCLSCQNGTNQTLYFYENNCLQTCPLHTYSSQEKQSCLVCIPPCNECTTSTYCLSCIQPFLFILYEGHCYLQCPIGTYITSQRQCMPCQQNCLRCIGDNNNGSICQWCKDQFYINLGQCLKKCPPQKYERSLKIYGEKFQETTLHQCIACQFPCIQCQSIILCKSCNQNYILTKANKCQTTCELGTFLVQINGSKICEYCEASCQLCTSLDNCLSCNQNFFIYQGQCLLECPKLYYPDNTKRSCQSCQLPCKQCESLKACTSCYTNSTQFIYLFQHQCLNQCPEKFTGIFDNTTLVYKCQKCQYPCQYCEGTINSCTNCFHLFYLLNNQCLQQCPIGYYAHDSMACFQCQYPCLSCINSADYCTSCLQNMYLRNGNCLEDCPIGFYMTVDSQNNSTKKCIKCQFPCRTCQFTSLNCTSCFGINNYVNQQADEYQCVQICPEKTYPNNLLRKCVSCFPQCLTCTHQNFCTSCSLGKYLIQNQCLDECPAQYYPSNTSNQCLSCESPCETCLDQFTCLSCLQQYFYHENNCVVSCPLAYYQAIYGNNRECKKCPESCYECYDYSTCKSCIQNSSRPYLQERNCVGSCSDRYYLDISSMKCLDCSKNCLSCISQNQCNKCTNSYLSNGKCVKQCPYKTYGDSSGQCLNCQSPCIQCYDTNNCKNCQQNYYLYLQFCLQNCPSQTWAYPHLRECHQQCKLFKVINQGKCVKQCPKFYNSDNQCVDKCRQGEFVNQTLGCQICTGDICDNLPLYRIQFVNSGMSIILAMIFSEQMEGTNQFTNKDSNIYLQKSQYIQKETLMKLKSTQKNQLSLIQPISVQIRNKNLILLEISIKQHYYLKHNLISMKKLFHESYPLQNYQSAITTLSVNTSYIVNSYYITYFGYVVSVFFILLLVINIFLDNAKCLFAPFEILQEVGIFIYLQIWFHPLLEYFMKGLLLFNFYGIEMNTLFSQKTTYWECNIKDIFHMNGCNEYQQLLQIAIFLLILIIVGTIGKIILCKFRRNKHIIVWNHINNFYWLFLYPIFIKINGINQICQIISTVIMVIASIIIFYQAIRSIFKNTYAQTTFFWQLKKSACKNQLGNTYYIMAMCRKMVIYFSIAFSPSKIVFPLSFATINSVFIIVNIFWNRPYKKYEILFPVLQTIYCLFLFILQLIIINSKQMSNEVWQSLSCICFILLLCIIVISGYIVLKETIDICQKNMIKYKKLKSNYCQSVQGKEHSQRTSSVSSKDKQKEASQKQIDSIKQESIQAQVQQKQERSQQVDKKIQNQNQDQSSISSIYTQAQISGNAAKFLYKIDKH